MLSEHGTGKPWISQLRHELRTPVNAILGYSEMLLEDLQDTPDAPAVFTLTAIVKNGRKILTQISSLIKIAETESNKSEWEPEPFRTKAQEAFSELLDNLTSNCDLLLSQTLTEDFRKDVVHIKEATARLSHTIDDNSLFYNNDQEKTSYSTIEQEEQSISSAPLNSQPRILIVDDIDTNRELLARRLSQAGYSYEEAENGREALELLRTTPFDLVLLDIMMPVMNGYETLGHLKSNDKWKDIPVLMISSLDELDSVVKCIQLGADDYLTKPFDAVLLRARVSACVDKKKSRDKEKEYHRQLEETNAKLSKANKKLENELQMARQVQMAMLPTVVFPKETQKQFDIFSFILPARTVGGDLYDFFLLDDGKKLCFALGDVSDKGTPAALFMARTITLFRSLTKPDDTPVDILKKQIANFANIMSSLCSLHCFVASSISRTGRLDCASAGHEYPFHINHAAKQTRILNIETGPALGFDEEAQFPPWSMELHPGDMVLVYSDGVIEARNSAQTEFSQERCLQMLNKSLPESPKSAVTLIQESVNAFSADAEQWDDITILAVQIKSSKKF